MTHKVTSQPSENTPIVMLHGLLGGPEHWQGIIPYISGICRPLLPRLPFFDDGMKLSSVSAVTYYVHNYLRNLGVDRIVLMGNSLGGHIATLLAIQMPNQICGLVLTGSGGLFERGFTKIPGSRPSRAWIYRKCCEVFHNEHHVTNRLVDSVMNVISDRPKLRILVQLAKSAKQENIFNSLKQISCPTLLIWGRQDRVTEPDVAEEFHRQILCSTLVWIDECGHTPMMEYPEMYGYYVRQWFKDTLNL